MSTIYLHFDPQHCLQGLHGHEVDFKVVYA